MKIPNNPEILLEQINVLSKIDLNNKEYGLNPSTTFLNDSRYKNAFSQNSSRRSKKALIKVSRMKKAYSITRSEILTTGEKEIADNSVNNQTESFKMIDDLNDNFDDEAKHLYMWTKNLSISDL